MSNYCALEISASRESALDYQLRSWTDPARPDFTPARPLEEFYGKNVLPLLWLPLFSPADLVRMEPPRGAQFKRVSKFVPELTPEPFHVLLSPVNAALERLRRQSDRTFSLIAPSSPHPDLRQFSEAWEARLARHADKWILLEPGDVFVFVEGDELATLLTDALKTIADDASGASAELAFREMMGDPFANPYGSTEFEIVQSWYHILAGGADDEDLSDSWPPLPSQQDISVAVEVLRRR